VWLECLSELVQLLVPSQREREGEGAGCVGLGKES
jgi:hypothetical protein